MSPRATAAQGRRSLGRSGRGPRRRRGLSERKCRSRCPRSTSCKQWEPQMGGADEDACPRHRPQAPRSRSSPGLSAVAAGPGRRLPDYLRHRRPGPHRRRCHSRAPPRGVPPVGAVAVTASSCLRRGTPAPMITRPYRHRRFRVAGVSLILPASIDPGEPSSFPLPMARVLSVPSEDVIDWLLVHQTGSYSAKDAPGRRPARLRAGRYWMLRGARPPGRWSTLRGPPRSR